MKKYKVLVTRYPEEFIFKAENKKQAIEFAKADCGFKVFKTEVEEIFDEKEECECGACENGDFENCEG